MGSTDTSRQIENPTQTMIFTDLPFVLNPPLQWQTYDIFFRAPRFDDRGDKTDNTRITVFHNGVLVHDDVELTGGTGRGGRFEEVPEAHFYLQRHTGPVHFRNVWLVENPTVTKEALRSLKAR